MTPEIPFLDLAEVNRPYEGRLQEAAARVIASGRYIGGPENEGLESDMRAVTGARYCVGTANGLDALTLSLRALIIAGRLAKGDGVLVPANTYIASWLAISAAGLRPIPVDPDPLTHNIDPAAIPERSLDMARAIMPVHLYGRLVDPVSLLRLATERSLVVVEDAAQAIGASLPGTPYAAGAIGDAAGFSFYPTKNVGALGDAGCATMRDRHIADLVRALGNYGTVTHYHSEYKCGANSRLDPLQAALLRVKLPDVHSVNGRRRRNAMLYAEAITNPLVSKPIPPLTPESHVWHQYVITLPDRRHRDALREHLGRQGIGTIIHYPVPPLRQKAYAEYASSADLPSTPVADDLAGRILSLPISQTLTERQVLSVCGAINAYPRH